MWFLVALFVVSFYKFVGWAGRKAVCPTSEVNLPSLLGKAYAPPNLPTSFIPSPLEGRAREGLYQYPHTNLPPQTEKGAFRFSSRCVRAHARLNQSESAQLVREKSEWDAQPRQNVANAENKKSPGRGLIYQGLFGNFPLHSVLGYGLSFLKQPLPAAMSLIDSPDVLVKAHEYILSSTGLNALRLTMQ